MKVKRVQDYISKDWFDETDGSYFERLNSRLQVLLRKDYPDLKGNDFISNISLLDYRLVFLDEVYTKIRMSRNNWIVELLLAKRWRMKWPDLVDLGFLSCHSLLLWEFGWG